MKVLSIKTLVLCHVIKQGIKPIHIRIKIWIAVLPLVKPEWWEKNQPLAVAVWSLLFIIPFAVTYSAGDAVETVLECILNDYLTFIVLLFGLFCVAGNISLQGDLTGSSKVNVVLLLIGTLLSSWIGTTGAFQQKEYNSKEEVYFQVQYQRALRQQQIHGVD